MIYIYIYIHTVYTSAVMIPRGQKLMKKLAEELGPVADAINAADSAFGAGAGQGMVDGMGDGVGLGQGQWHQSLSDDQNEEISHSLGPEWWFGKMISILTCELQKFFRLC